MRAYGGSKPTSTTINREPVQGGRTPEQNPFSYGFHSLPFFHPSSYCKALNDYEWLNP